MNEKLIDILEMVQRTAVQVGDTAADVAYGVGKRRRSCCPSPS